MIIFIIPFEFRTFTNICSFSMCHTHLDLTLIEFTVFHNILARTVWHAILNCSIIHTSVLEVASTSAMRFMILNL